MINPWIGSLQTLADQQARWNRTSRTYAFQLEYPQIRKDANYVLAATFVLLAVTLLLFVTRSLGWIYLAGAVGLGLLLSQFDPSPAAAAGVLTGRVVWCAPIPFGVGIASPGATTSRSPTS